MSALSLSYWENDVYWRQNNKHFEELAPQNDEKQLMWRNYVTVTYVYEPCAVIFICRPCGGTSTDIKTKPSTVHAQRIVQQPTKIRGILETRVLHLSRNEVAKFSSGNFQNMHQTEPRCFANSTQETRSFEREIHRCESRGINELTTERSDGEPRSMPTPLRAGMLEKN